MKLGLKKGVTSQTVLLFIQNSSVTTGAGLTGLVFNSSGLSAYYYREEAGTGATAITLATATLGTWASGGFKEVDATNMPGWYELGIPNAALASGADFVGIQLKGATNMAQTNLEIQLLGVDWADAVRGGMSALPNAAADAAGGLPISDAGGLDMDSIKTDTAAILVDTGTTLDGRIPAALVGGRMDCNVGAISTDSTAADNAEAFFDGTGYAGTNNVIPTVTTVGTLTTYTGNTPQTGDCFARIGAAGASLTDLGGMSTTMKGQVNTEVLDVLNVDTFAEASQGTPGATITLAAKIGYLYKAWRNKSTQTSTTYSLFNDDAATVDHKATVSDDGTTATKGEVATGP